MHKVIGTSKLRALFNCTIATQNTKSEYFP